MRHHKTVVNFINVDCITKDSDMRHATTYHQYTTKVMEEAFPNTGILVGFPDMPEREIDVARSFPLAHGNGLTCTHELVKLNLINEQMDCFFSEYFVVLTWSDIAAAVLLELHGWLER